MPNKGPLRKTAASLSQRESNYLKKEISCTLELDAAAGDQMRSDEKELYIFKEITNAEPKMKKEPRKKLIFVRNDKEKGSVFHFAGGYHISKL